MPYRLMARPASCLSRSHTPSMAPKSCSQILRTFHPSLRSWSVWRWSLALFLSILSSQYWVLTTGMRRWSGQACQKQLSRNTTTPASGNQKSGRPAIWCGCLKKLVTPAERNSSSKFRSIREFLFRTAAMARCVCPGSRLLFVPMLPGLPECSAFDSL